MAIAVPTAAGNFATISPGNSSSRTVTKFANCADGDILIAAIAHELDRAITPPTGWTQIAQATAGGTIWLTLFWKRAASEPSSWTFTYDAIMWNEIHVFRVTGCLASGDVLDGTPSTNGTTGSTATWNSVTTTAANSAAFCIGGVVNDGTNWASWSNSFTEAYDNSKTGIAWKIQASAGAVGSTTATIGSGAHAAIMFALKDAAGGGGGAQSITPDGLANAPAYGASTLTPGAVTIAPGGLGNATGFGAAAITSLVTLIPAGLGNTPAAGTPTLAPGAITLQPAGLANTPGFGGATLIPGVVTVQPAGLANAPAAGIATITSLVTLTPAGLGNTSGFGTSAIAPGAVTLQPGGLANAPAFGPTTLTAGAGPTTLAPDGLANTPLFGVATLTPGAVVLAPQGLGLVPGFGVASVGGVGGDAPGTTAAVTLADAPTAILTLAETATATLALTDVASAVLALADVATGALSLADGPAAAIELADAPSAALTLD